MNPSPQDFPDLYLDYGQHLPAGTPLEFVEDLVAALGEKSAHVLDQLTMTDDDYGMAFVLAGEDDIYVTIEERVLGILLTLETPYVETIRLEVARTPAERAIVLQGAVDDLLRVPPLRRHI